MARCAAHATRSVLTPPGSITLTESTRRAFEKTDSWSISPAQQRMRAAMGNERFVPSLRVRDSRLGAIDDE